MQCLYDVVTVSSTMSLYCKNLEYLKCKAMCDTLVSMNTKPLPYFLIHQGQQIVPFLWAGNECPKCGFHKLWRTHRWIGPQTKYTVNGMPAEIPNVVTEYLEVKCNHCNWLGPLEFCKDFVWKESET